MFSATDFWSVTTYAIYFLVACGVTIWVARSLKRYMPQFFQTHPADESHVDPSELTRSMTHLIVIGFYLVNFGAISLALKSNERILNEVDAVELLSFKVGAVLLVQGLVHFAIVAKLFSMKQDESLRRSPAPAVTTPHFDDPKAV